MRTGHASCLSPLLLLAILQHLPSLIANINRAVAYGSEGHNFSPSLAAEC